MFYPVSRVEPAETGLRFYEKDILYCQYVLTGNADIEIEASFLAPGLGVVFMETGDDALKPDRGFLIRIGYNDCLILQKKFSETITLKHTSCLLAPPVSNIKLRFCKEGQTISAVYNGKEIAKTTLPHDMDEFRFGIYSNAGNIIKKTTVYLDAPVDWLSEVNNTNGGILYFKRNKIEMINGEHDVEVECEPIELEPGRYYLSGKFTGEMTPYVFMSNDQEEEDSKKNILDGNAFTVEKAGEYSLKIKGAAGTAEELSISMDQNSAFVATTDGGKTVDGSCLLFNLENVKTIEWTAVINSVQDGDYALVHTAAKEYGLNELWVEFNLEYKFSYDTETEYLYIQGDEANPSEISIRLNLTEADNNTLGIFRNVDAAITRLIIIDKSGSENNVLLQSTHKSYVPGSISGPIIVLDENNMPFDLSSSYRVDNSYYIFTNREREIFDPKEGIVPEKAVNEKIQDIKLYGVRKASEIDEAKIYFIDGEDNPHICAPSCELIDPLLFEYKDGKIETEECIKEYERVILDYLKDKSYCINYMPNIDTYEVDISTSEGEFYILSDSGEKQYALTNISPNSSKFIVLAREVK